MPEVMQCMEVWGGNELADRAVEMPGLNAQVFSRPHGGSQGGGDVYYVSACATGRITRLLIADVSGHGAAVCDTAGILRSLMRRFVNYIDQTRFVRLMNEQFVALSASSCFATAVVATFFSPTGHVSLCNAGHPPPLLYRASTRQWSLLEQREPEIAESNLPLGVLELTQYEQFEVDLHPGDQILCYTDSLIESRSPDGEMLGTAGVLDIARSIKPAPGKTFIASLLDEIQKKYPGNLDADDVTVLSFQANGTGRGTPISQRLLSPLRVARGLIRSLIRREPLPLPEFSIPNLGGALFDSLGRIRKPRNTHRPQPDHPELAS